MLNQTKLLGTIVNQALAYLHGGSFENTLTIPLNWDLEEKYRKNSFGTLQCNY